MDDWNGTQYDDDESRATRGDTPHTRCPLAERLWLVKQHLMAVDGWSKADVDTINEAIERLA